MADEDLGLGTDWLVDSDLSERITLVSGRDNLALAILRRLSTPRGGLFYDPDYGLDLRLWLSADFNLSDVQRLGSQIEDEVLKDERVQAATAEVTYSLSTEALAIQLTLEDAAGPFQLILSVDAVSVSILRGGAPQATAAPATAAPVVVEVVQSGGVGQRGPAGPPGASGSSSFELAVDDDGEHYVIGATETIVGNAWLLNLAGAPASLTATLTAAAMVSGGTGTMRLRIGGTESGIDGTVVAAVSFSSTSFAAALASGELANPGGQTWVKVTAQTGGASDVVYVRRPAVVLKD